ncbi:MAG: ABC transporter ATP-binding protein [Bacteroides sp.]|nr:ABC transporter ATP-binding protein [Eubacterium sp.]MCM1417847.1 ABC transporter ATP-binding protein [Roseburia sp.]MCM1461286.1 ABC transporter ATP-binding protein [Bacteroides sp.]
MKNAVISAEDLSVGYFKRRIVNGVSFAVSGGEILTLIGPNGAGKSTILKTLAGYLKALSGEILIAGKNIEAVSPDELSRTLSVLLTERTAPELMTCREVIETGRYPYTGRFGRLSGRDREIVIEAIGSVEIGDLADKNFVAISDGQRQRVLLARAIAQEPKILILDEPTSYLDIRHKILFLETLRRLASEKRIAVILSMHELELAAKVSDRVLCIKDGHVIRAGTSAEIFTEDNIREIYDLPKKLYQKYIG